MCSERTTWHHFTFLLSGLSQQVGGGHNGRGLYLPCPKIGTSPKTGEFTRLGHCFRREGWLALAVAPGIRVREGWGWGLDLCLAYSHS
jgi:hypothetical protein